jgi:acyl carrier protein
MENKEKLFQSFATALNIPILQISEDLKYQSIPEWDSITHMILISQLEDDFNISIETDDVIDMSSVLKAKEILSKYGVPFEPNA